MTASPDRVRPTRRCLSDIGVSVPDLGVMLDDLEHPIIVRAQNLPATVAAGGAERIRSLTDRVWFKVKTASWRAAVCEVEPPAGHIPHRWWLGAAGLRTADSSQHDFYARLEADAHRGGANSCSTDQLLPGDWDLQRLLAEAAVLATRLLPQLVRSAAAESMLNHDIRSFNFGDRNVRVRVQMFEDGRVYLAIGATGSLDAPFMVTLLSAIPGAAAQHWLPEPSELLGLRLAPGEILWSTILDPEAQVNLLDSTEGADPSH